MNNEIQEILELIGNSYYYGNITEVQKEKYCNYITNLQKEIENKNNEIDSLKDQVEWWRQQCDDLEMQIGENNG